MTFTTFAQPMSTMIVLRKVGLALASAITAFAPCGCGDDDETTGTGGGATPSTVSGSPTTGGGTCAPGQTASCYTGPEATADVGACKRGSRACLPDGTGFGECSDEVVPAAESCATPADDDCDGLTNEEGSDCTCLPGATASCYTGPPGTLGVGLCKSGTRTCNPDGLDFGECEGEHTPTPETCGVAGDDDCDGATNEEGPDCACVPGSVDACYSAPPETHGVGICLAGTQVCNPDGLGYGPCEGEVTPGIETCNTNVDDDCDGSTNEEGDACVCIPDSIVDCYGGPAETLGVGQCTSGVATCNAEGTAVGVCAGDVVPSSELCVVPGDEDCDGLAAECTPGHIWSKGFSGFLHEALHPYSPTIVANGSQILLIGRTKPTSVDLGGGPLPASYQNAVIGRFDASGNHLYFRPATRHGCRRRSSTPTAMSS